MIDSQNILGAVLFIVLFTCVMFLATVDSFKPLTAYIISPPIFFIVLYFQDLPAGKESIINEDKLNGQ
tara:strand:+ start:1396 stop:1599 length:204 start_codon:yes stop_codon:yes gene_type:complete